MGREVMSSIPVLCNLTELKEKQEWQRPVEHKILGEPKSEAL
jgi:hypothetical protein